MEDIKKQLEVTPISDLKRYSKGDIVQLPPFSSGQPFFARLRRPSMMIMMKNGKIPNSLLSTANSLFGGGISDIKENDDVFKEVLSVIECLAEASFTEPTWKDLQEAGIELTDEQLMFVFQYTQKGVKALDSFRGQQPGYGDYQNLEDVQEETE